MKQHLKKLASGAAGIGIFILGCALAGLGLWFVFMLALFALAVAGLGVLAAPLVAFAQRADTTETPAS